MTTTETSSPEVDSGACSCGCSSTMTAERPDTDAGTPAPSGGCTCGTDDSAGCGPDCACGTAS